VCTIVSNRFRLAATDRSARTCRLRTPDLSRAVGRRDLPRDGQFELFDALASADKQLIARPGPYAQTHPDDQTSWQDFIRLNTPRVTR
jgi:hypothetical protein